MLRSLPVVLSLAACAPAAMSIGAEHPANPSAPAGRLAGPPPALRPGVVDETQPGEPPKPPLLRSDPPKQAPPAHDGHKH